ncbi:hypothetical protein MANES_09G001401v8 [Manihot esculenta]|uniref:Uncharacterized protein n=1 Tax=Manihot esculenta TaxID=3983 RepID=A0ACB7H3G1_MANES|nr:hypothetical protein MANES_09G001401v8 [Manihot esculenta]
MYLKCFVGARPKKRVDWMPWAEYYYNTSFHSSLHTTPFQVVYGREPSRLLSYAPGSSQVDVVDKALIDRDEVLCDIRLRLQQAQHHMKQFYDQGHRNASFVPGDFVWLRLHPHQQLSISSERSNKLGPLFYGPFKIIKPVGNVAYELELSLDSKIHNVFHVSLLRNFNGALPSETPLMVRLNRGTWEILINLEPVPLFQDAYPDYQLEDKLFVQGEGSPMDAFVGRAYRCRNKQAASLEVMFLKKEQER